MKTDISLENEINNMLDIRQDITEELTRAAIVEVANKFFSPEDLKIADSVGLSTESHYNDEGGSTYQIESLTLIQNKVVIADTNFYNLSEDEARTRLRGLGAEDDDFESMKRRNDSPNDWLRDWFVDYSYGIKLYFEFYPPDTVELHKKFKYRIFKVGE